MPSRIVTWLLRKFTPSSPLQIPLDMERIVKNAVLNGGDPRELSDVEIRQELGQVREQNEWFEERIRKLCSELKRRGLAGDAGGPEDTRRASTNRTTNEKRQGVAEGGEGKAQDGGATLYRVTSDRYVSASAIAAATGATPLPPNLARSSSSSFSSENWKPDHDALVCEEPSCGTTFSWINRRHHCRGCGGVFCDECSRSRVHLPPHKGYGHQRQRVCDRCASEAMGDN